MSAVPRKPSLRYADDLALEARTGVRHEYLDGEAWMMAVGSIRRSAVKVNLVGSLYIRLQGRPCRVFDSDLKTIVPPTGLATCADVAVICGRPEVAAQDPHAATNPLALFEVLSPSTEAWDRGRKFHHYRQLDSLQRYVFVSVDAARVEVCSRGADGAWLLREYGPGQALPLPALDVELPVDALYLDLPEEPADQPSRVFEARPRCPTTGTPARTAGSGPSRYRYSSRASTPTPGGPGRAPAPSRADARRGRHDRG